MKILWSDFSIQMLFEIYNYYKEKASPVIAKKIKAEIFTAAKQLKKHPSSGQIELNGHRYLLTGNYKIVYK